MPGKHGHLKQAAIDLRKKGSSIRDIEITLGIPRSTLSGWLKHIELTGKQKQVLNQKWKAALKKAVINASIANRAAKQSRIKKIRQDAQNFVRKVKLNNATLEIFLAGLYLGEGFKNAARTGFCNSKPEIVKTFVELLRRLYNTDEAKFAAGIYARADQNPDELVKFWSETLNIPPEKFHKTQLDKRTAKTKTFEGYKGVCAVYYYDASIERRLAAISAEIIRTRSSAG